MTYRLRRTLGLALLLLIGLELRGERDAYCLDFGLLGLKFQPRAARVFIRHLTGFLSLHYSTQQYFPSGRYATLNH